MHESDPTQSKYPISEYGIWAISWINTISDEKYKSAYTLNGGVLVWKIPRHIISPTGAVIPRKVQIIHKK